MNGGPKEGLLFGSQKRRGRFRYDFGFWQPTIQEDPLGIVKTLIRPVCVIIVLPEVEVLRGLTSVRKVCQYHVGNFLSWWNFLNWHLMFLGDLAINWFSSLQFYPHLVSIINFNGLLLGGFSILGGGAQVDLNLFNGDQVWVDLPSSYPTNIVIMHIIGVMFRLSSRIISF